MSFSVDFPNPGIEPVSPASPALAGGFFTTVPLRKAVQSAFYHHHEQVIPNNVSIQMHLSKKRYPSLQFIHTCKKVFL